MKDDIVERARWMANGEAKAGIGKVRRALFEELADEIERLRHPKVIVGSRKVWEAMGEIVSEAEIERLKTQLYHATAAVDAIREHALEEAAKVAEDFYPNQTYGIPIAFAIRALKEQPDV